MACFLLGVFIYSSWLNKSILNTVRDQVIRDNIQTAQQMTKLLREMGFQSLSDKESWERLQDVVEQIQLPNDGFVCVVDSQSGLLICHPMMRAKPELRNVPVGKSSINVEGRDSDILRAVEINNGIAGGVSQIKGETQIVAAARISELDINVLVHQRAKGINQAVSEIIGPVRTIGVAVSVLISLILAGACIMIIQRYENRLEEKNKMLEEAVRNRTRALMKTRNAVIFGLAKLAESRDTDTGEHLERIGKYVAILATRLLENSGHADKDFIEKLTLASSLHDIGKVGIPDAILLKPGRFTPDERRLMELHCELGGECLKAIQRELGSDDFLELATEIAFCHHEKWDGTGYPYQKSGNSIPLSARIVALADVYDALTSKRPYKEAMSHQAASKIIIEGRGRHFDPTIVDLFIDSESEFAAVAAQYSSELASLSSLEELCSKAAEITEDLEPVGIA